MRRTESRAIIALVCSVPLALLIVVVSGPTPWMGAVFAAVICLPQIVIWSRFRSGSGAEVEHDRRLR
jgi:Flp pilus assembly protein TadB